MPTARKLPSGSWRCQVFSHYEEIKQPDGTIKKKRIYESFTSDDPTREGKKEAEAIAVNFSLHKKHKNRPSNLTLSDAIDQYISIKKSVLSASTIAGYKKIRKYAFRPLMLMRLRDITTSTLTDAISKECVRKTKRKGIENKISPKTIRNEFGLLTAVLNYYEVDYNPKKIVLPQVPTKKIDLPAPEKIVSAIVGTDIELPALLAMWLSFSESEIAGLTKSGSLLQSGRYITISDVILTIDGKEVCKDTGKNPNRERVLELPLYLKALIDKVPGDRIVPMPTNTIYRKLKRYLIEKGVEPITFHQLRHVNASVMHMLKIPDKYAQDRGGWATNYVMKKVYMNTFTDQRQTVDHTIDSYFNSIVQHEMQHKNKKP